LSGVESDATVVAQYQRALDEFRKDGADRARAGKRMSELVSLLELSTALVATRSPDEILQAALLVVMGELGVSQGACLLRGPEGEYEVRVTRGLPRALEGRRVAVPGDLAQRELGLALLLPVGRGGRPPALLGLGAPADGKGFEPDELAWLRVVANVSATPIENALVYEELASVNRKLQAKLFELNNLFDLSRELTASFDEDAIKEVVTATLMGHLMASRCALYVLAEDSFAVVHQRGVRLSDAASRFGEAAVARAFAEQSAAVATQALCAGALRDALHAARLTHIIRLSIAGRNRGFFAIGGRPREAALSDEDCDFATTLGRQAIGALDAVRLHRVKVLKERQDRELQIARGIQQSLLPSRRPQIPGFELAARSESCFEIGGDYYDFVPLDGGHVGLVVADVSGKGTPASLLMASVHAFVQALAGAPPIGLITGLNRFLYRNTQANKFVTLFYAELDPGERRLAYVNAGHVPPFLCGRARALRLEAGGPVLGLIEDAGYEEGTLTLAENDLVAIVTDGATEALSDREEELGDERVRAALEGARQGTADAVLDTLFATVNDWSGARGRSDDLTALVLKAH
jgi:sigma-B regulation protein RsbU (phosphoserine phosphatase)